jgi:DNA-binding NtrC family response regulator
MIVPGHEDRIAQLESRLASEPSARREPAVSELELLADLYLQADHYTPALETIERLLERPEARALSADRRAGLESKCITCKLLRGDAQGALAHAREIMLREASISSTPLRSRLHLQSGEALFALSRLEDAATAAARGLELADETGDLSLSAWALSLTGRLAYRGGELEQARDLYEQSLALYRRIGDDTGAAHVRNNLALIHKTLCEWEAAATYLKQTLETHRRTGHLAETLAPMHNLGIVYQKSGDWKQAADWYGQARQVAIQLGDERRGIHVAIGLGNVARLERRWEEAHTLLGEALERSRAQGSRREEVLALEFLGELSFDREKPEDALARYQEALRLAERVCPEGDLVVEIERRSAEAYLAVGRLDAAESACQRAGRLARQIDDRLEFAVTERIAGSIALARGRHDDAFVSWKVAVSLLEAAHERLELGKTLLAMGRASTDAAHARRYLYRAGALFAGLSIPYWLELTEREIERAGASAETHAPRPTSLMGRRHRAPGLVACSNAMRQVETLARRAASTELSVLITGETGTGKELIARTIHSLSARAARPFLAINCGALRVELALSQLFGHRKGAFTGAHADGAGLVEAAHGGTLFLDEVGELPLDVQVTLLRFLESGEYMRLGETEVRRADVRIITATNRELRGADEKLFRRDLLFRLNEVEIRVPALRERRDDVTPLARHFLAFYGGIDGPTLTTDAESVLRAYPWPGNVRELENVMKRVAALHAGDAVVSADTLVPFLNHPEGGSPEGSPGGSRDRSIIAGPVGPARDDRREILDAYAQARGNKSRAAALLGISRKTLYARLKRLNLDLP